MDKILLSTLGKRLSFLPLYIIMFMCVCVYMYNRYRKTSINNNYVVNIIVGLYYNSITPDKTV